MAYPTSRQLNQMQSAVETLLTCYTDLAAQRSHLLSEIVNDHVPRQWAHYPDDDVIDGDTGYQFFYHSHSPEDRDATSEHGHFHVFARQAEHGASIDLDHEQDWLTRLNSEHATDANTIHLLCVSLNAKGVPTALFTVNRWVTGDHLFSAATTLRLLSDLAVDNQQAPRVSQWLTALLAIFEPQIAQLLIARDQNLLELASKRRKSGLLEDESIEVLSSVAIDIDQQIAWLFNDAHLISV